MRWLSRDGHWRVTVISLDGRTLLRVEHDRVQGTPLHVAPTRRQGGWFLAGDVSDVSQVERFVPLSELQEI
jgi:hypothetical protein